MKSTKSLLPVLFFTVFLIIFVGWNSASAISTDSQIQGSILYVKPGANGTCTSWADACELQTALSTAAVRDQIWVAAGTYKPTTDTNRTANFQLRSGVAIYGGFPAVGGEWFQRNLITNFTTLSGDIGVVGNTGDNSYHVVTGNGVDGTSVLDGFTITGGNADGTSPNNGGGGIYNSAGSPTLTDITFSGNSATRYGGGMYNNNSSNPTLINVTFYGNTATADYSYGGGMCNRESSNPILSTVTFENNSTVWSGGGMYNGSSHPILTNVTFSGNSSMEYGGGMSNVNSSPQIRDVTFINNSGPDFGGGMSNEYNSNPILNNVTFSGNMSYEGGGMYNHQSNPWLEGVTFSMNTVSQNGGGMYNDQSDLILINATLSGNSASGVGGGMYNFQSNPYLENVTFFGNDANNGGGIANSYCFTHVWDSIIWSNSPNQISDSNSFTIISYSDIQGGWEGTGNINQNPLLGSLADNVGITLTHALGEGSPAIDTGDPDYCPSTDQRGFIRPIDGDENGMAVCDMGAYEYGSTGPGISLFLPLILK